MRSRYVWPVLLGLLPCLAAGCVVAGKHDSVSNTLAVGQMPQPGDKREVSELPPQETARVCIGTADKLFEAGKDTEAIMLYEKARSTDPNNKWVSRRLALLYDRQGLHQKARDEYSRALTLMPNDANLLNDLGYSCYARGMMDDAELNLSKAVAADPKHKRAWVNLGLVLGHKGRYNDSLEAFSSGVSRAQAHANLAFIYSTQGKKDEAKRSYLKALELEADMPFVREALARLDSPGKADPQGGKYSKKLESFLEGTPDSGTARAIGVEMAKPVVAPAAELERVQPRSQFVPAERPAGAVAVPPLPVLPRVANGGA